MDTQHVFLNLLWLIPITVFSLLMLLPRKATRVLPATFWMFIFCANAVPLGGYLGALVSALYGQPLMHTAFYWQNDLLYTFEILICLGFIGWLFAYGVLVAARNFIDLTCTFMAKQPECQI